jgi:hypothetical protein
MGWGCTSVVEHFPWICKPRVPFPTQENNKQKQKKSDSSGPWKIKYYEVLPGNDLGQRKKLPVNLKQNSSNTFNPLQISYTLFQLQTLKTLLAMSSPKPTIPSKHLPILQESNWSGSQKC